MARLNWDPCLNDVPGVGWKFLFNCGKISIMFEKIILRRSESGGPISAGQLSEALLFYQKVHIVFDRGTVIHLAKHIGLDGLLAVLRRPDVNAVYCEESLGTISNPIGSQTAHSFAAFTIVGHHGLGKYKSSTEVVQHMLEREGFKKSDCRRFSNEFHELVPVRKLSGDYFLKGGITSAAKGDLSDREFLLKAVNEVLRLTPGVDQSRGFTRFDIWDTELGFYVLTDIDFKLINLRRSLEVPPLEPINSAHMLSSILDARADLAIASFYGGDFVTSAAMSIIIQIRHLELLRRTGINADSLCQFHEINFPDCPSIREVIDARDREFEDMLRLLDKADRFKDWLAGVSPDEGIMRAYLREATAASWVQKIPAKSLRYVMTTAIGALNPIAGALASIGDSFLVEKVLGGWRPNHFIDNRLSPFLQR